MRRNGREKEITLNTCPQVPESGCAPQLETGTGNPPPPGGGPFFPHANQLYRHSGKRKPQRSAPPLITTGAQCCSGANSQLPLQQLCRSMLFYVPIMQRVCRLLKCDTMEAVQSQWNVELNSIESMMHFRVQVNINHTNPVSLLSPFQVQDPEKLLQREQRPGRKPKRSNPVAKDIQSYCKGRGMKLKELQRKRQSAVVGQQEGQLLIGKKAHEEP